MIRTYPVYMDLMAQLSPMARLYHTHLIIPGQRFDSFLKEIVDFLVARPSEIVVVRICADGIQQCEIPTANAVIHAATQALGTTGIQLGDSNAFRQPISTLRLMKKRLILVINNPKYDSYSTSAYYTLDPNTITKSFAEMTTAGQDGHDYTVLQCQVSSMRSNHKRCINVD